MARRYTHYHKPDAVEEEANARARDAAERGAHFVVWVSGTHESQAALENMYYVSPGSKRYRTDRQVTAVYVGVGNVEPSLNYEKVRKLVSERQDAGRLLTVMLDEDIVAADPHRQHTSFSPTWSFLEALAREEEWPVIVEVDPVLFPRNDRALFSPHPIANGREWYLWRPMLGWNTGEAERTLSTPLHEIALASEYTQAWRALRPKKEVVEDAIRDPASLDLFVNLERWLRKPLRRGSRSIEGAVGLTVEDARRIAAKNDLAHGRYGERAGLDRLQVARPVQLGLGIG